MLRRYLSYAAGSAGVWLLLPGQAFAGFGAVVTYGGAAASVPALSGYALIALAGLIAVAVFRLRRHPALYNNRLLGAALAVTVIATGASGVKMTYAIGFATPAPLENPQGGEVRLGLGTSCLRNETDGNLFVTGITPNGPTVIDTERQLAFCSEDPIDNGGANAGEAPVCSASPSTQLAPQKACSVTVVELGQEPG